MDEIRLRSTNGRSIQARGIPAHQWTARKRRGFLDHLATTCNVAAAARSIGMTESGVYALRRRDPAFAESWREAIDLGTERLRAMLVQRAMGGEETDAGAAGGPPLLPDPSKMDTQLALRLIAENSRRDSTTVNRGNARPRSASKADLIAALERQLAVLRRRLARESARGALVAPAEGAAGEQAAGEGAAAEGAHAGEAQ